MQVFSILYFICSYIYIIPQIYTLVITKSSNDYSLWQLLISFIGAVCWTIYIYTSKQSIIIYVGNALDILFLLIVDFFILKYYKRDK